MKKYIYNSGNKSQKLLILIYIFFSASFYPLSGGEPIILSSDLKSYIEKIEYDLLGVSKGVNEITVIDKNIIHVRIFFIRSEEHTSELQSRPHLVCRLLLEKKKKK